VCADFEQMFGHHGLTTTALQQAVSDFYESPLKPCSGNKHMLPTSPIFPTPFEEGVHNTPLMTQEPSTDPRIELQPVTGVWSSNPDSALTPACDSFAGFDRSTSRGRLLSDGVTFEFANATWDDSGISGDSSAACSQVRQDHENFQVPEPKTHGRTLTSYGKASKQSKASRPAPYKFRNKTLEQDGVTFEFANADSSWDVSDDNSVAACSQVRQDETFQVPKTQTSPRTETSYGKAAKQSKTSKQSKAAKANRPAIHVTKYCKTLDLSKENAEEAQGYCTQYLALAPRSRRDFVLAASALYLVLKKNEIQPHDMENVTHEAMGKVAGASKSAVQRCSSEMKEILGIEVPN